MNIYKKNLNQLKQNFVYNETMEHDACGVGLVASTEGVKSRKVVEYGIQALKAVWHRGAIDADGKTITLSDTTNGPIKIENLSIYGINSAQKEPTSFFNVQPIDGAGNNIGKTQKLYDNNQLPSKQIDNVQSTQLHIANRIGEVGARTNSLTRQSDSLANRRLAVERDVSELKEADLAALVTNLQSKLTSMQASQQSFVKISQLNLFDYLR